MEDRKFSESPKNKMTKITWGIIILAFIIFLGACVFRIATSVSDIKATFQPSKELINETVSSDGKYKVQAYLVNGGATTDWAVRCYLKEGNNKKEKLIYNDYHIEEADMTWIDGDTISINGHDIDLPNGKYDFRDE